MEFFNKLSATSAAGGVAARGVEGMSVESRKGNGVLYRSSLGILARARSAFMVRMTNATSDVSEDVH